MPYKLPAALAVLLCGTLAIADEPLDVGSRKQLFIDRQFIAKSEGIELTTNPAQKLGMLKGADGQSLGWHVSRVIDDGGKIKLYTGAEGLTIWESENGLEFRQAGSIPGGTLPTVFLDPHDPDPARRYKLFRLQSHVPFDHAVDGVFAFISSDGVNFKEVGRVLPFYTDNPAIVNWDQRLGKYVIYVRALAYDSENQRRVARIEVDDPLQPWPYKQSDELQRPVPFFSTQNSQVVLAADEHDDPHSDIYYSAPSIYPWAQDVYLMFPAHFRHFSPSRNPFIRPRVAGQWEDYGLLEVQLAVSRDGIRWHRPTREAYFPMGLADEWDRWLTVMGPGIVRRGNYLYQYYGSSGRLHDSAILRPEYDESAPEGGGIGLVRQRLDGFVSADAGTQGGWLETPLIKFSGNCLRLNIDTGAMGTAFVELRDESGRPIPGFALSDCEEIGGNFIDQRVYWKGTADLSPLAGRAIRMHVRLKRSKLYAFQFGKQEAK